MTFVNIRVNAELTHNEHLSSFATMFSTHNKHTLLIKMLLLFTKNCSMSSAVDLLGVKNLLYDATLESLRSTMVIGNN